MISSQIYLMKGWEGRNGELESPLSSDFRMYQPFKIAPFIL